MGRTARSKVRQCVERGREKGGSPGIERGGTERMKYPLNRRRTELYCFETSDTKTSEPKTKKKGHQENERHKRMRSERKSLNKTRKTYSSGQGSWEKGITKGLGEESRKRDVHQGGERKGEMLYGE